MMLNKLILLTVTTVVGEPLCPIDQMVSRQKLVSDSQTKTKYSQLQHPTSLIAYHKRNISACSNKCQDKS